MGTRTERCVDIQTADMSCSYPAHTVEPFFHLNIPHSLGIRFFFRKHQVTACGAYSKYAPASTTLKTPLTQRDAQISGSGAYNSQILGQCNVKMMNETSCAISAGASAMFQCKHLILGCVSWRAFQSCRVFVISFLRSRSSCHVHITESLMMRWRRERQNLKARWHFAAIVCELAHITLRLPCGPHQGKDTTNSEEGVTAEPNNVAESPFCCLFQGATLTLV